MQQYLNLMGDILDNGVNRMDRTGTGTKSLFGPQLTFDLTKGFPLLTTKEVNFKAVVHELLWFLSGSTNIKYLNDNGVHIWDGWADDGGELGPVYGKQWRSWNTGYDWSDKSSSIDQIAKIIETLNTDSYSRRMLVSAWNVGELEDMALEPCHVLFQFYSRPMTMQEMVTVYNNYADSNIYPEKLTTLDYPVLLELMAQNKLPRHYLDCKLYQRSADMFLGVPFNIASYALLTKIIAQLTGHMAHRFIHSFGDVHLYLNHLDQAREQLSREPRSLPWVDLLPIADYLHPFTGNALQSINSLKYEHVHLEGYNPYPAIKAPISL